MRPQLSRGGLVHYSKIGVPEMSTIARSCSSVVSLSFIVIDERVNCRPFSENSQNCFHTLDLKVRAPALRNAAL